MSQADHDSGLQLVFGSWADAEQPASGNGIPVLDLTSDGPLPIDLAELESGPAGRGDGTFMAGPPAIVATVPEAEPALKEGQFWLQGEVVMCGCPDCGAPMSIRLWLMIADCWMCGTSIELNEEQEREVERLLKKRRQSQQSAARQQAPKEEARQKTRPTAAPVAPKKEVPKEPERARRQTPVQPKTTPPRPTPQPRREAPKRVAAAQRPVGVRAKIRKMAVLGGVRVFVRDLFKDMPAWLISLVFHLVLLTLLGLWTYEDQKEEPLITLAATVHPDKREGGDPTVTIDPSEERYDVLEKEIPKDEAQRKALILAHQEAKQLRLDPDAHIPHVPDTPQIKKMIGSDDDQKRMLAVRDPRVRIEMVKKEGGTTMSEACVARGLRWISRQQNPDGGWGLKGGRSDAAGTSLALLPFLGAGQTQHVGQYQEEVSKGLRWMIQNQGPDGDLRAGTTGNHGMYAHGQAAIVLCEAFAMTGDEALRAPAQKAVDFIVKAQHQQGGWRYQPGQAGDTSVVGWQLMALQSARAAHLDVPEDTMERAEYFLDSVQHRNGALYAYQAKGRGPTETMTAEGLLCRMYLGWNRNDNPEMVEGVDFLVDSHLPRPQQANIYYWYYATQVMHHMGGKQWEKWNEKMRPLLVKSQITSGKEAGSWTPRGQWGGAGGRLFETALSTCTLEVYYRHAPIFRQIKLD